MDSEQRKEYNKLYREKNKEIIAQQKQKWYLENKVINKLNRQKYYQDNKEEIIEKVKIYREDNLDKVKVTKNKYYVKNKKKIIDRHNEYNKIKKKNDPLFKLSVNIRTSIYNNLRKLGKSKISKTNVILGCSFEDFKQHLESKFEPWMTWDNYGKYNGELNFGWDIDHIIPISTAKTEETVMELNHYSNLQPLCSKVNRDIKRS